MPARLHSNRLAAAGFPCCHSWLWWAAVPIHSLQLQSDVVLSTCLHCGLVLRPQYCRTSSCLSGSLCTSSSTTMLSTVQSSSCCYMLAAEDGEQSQEQQGLPDGQAHAGVLQDAMFRWEPSVSCHHTGIAPNGQMASPLSSLHVYSSQPTVKANRPVTTLPARMSQAMFLAASYCSPDTTHSCCLHVSWPDPCLAGARRMP